MEVQEKRCGWAATVGNTADFALGAALAIPACLGDAGDEDRVQI